MIPILIMNGILVAIAVLLLIAEKFLVTFGTCRITINKEKILTVDGGDPLLSYFVQNKIYIPSACGGKATCGYCKVEVLSGGGKLLPTEEVFIPRQDRQKGIRLACQVKVKKDIEVLVPPELLEAREIPATVKEIRDLAPGIKHVFLKLEGASGIKFKAGQYVQFKIPETDEFRAYSVASSPSQRDTVELTVRLVGGGLCSTYIHEILDVGDKIVLTGPFGDFYLREDSDRKIVCIAGGCGMAPIRSLLLCLKEKGMPREIDYFFGARTRSDLFFTDELFDLARNFSRFRYIPALSEPKPQDNWTGETGLITQVVERMVPADPHTEAYLCGPPPMIDAAIKVLSKKGISEAHIYYDKF